MAMNAKLQFIFARRSVRKFRDEAVSEEVVKDLLEAAMAAPSACCKDPWRFMVVRGAAMLGRMADGLPNGPMLRDAPLAIVVCGHREEAHGGSESYMLQDCSAAIENLLLAASALGVGACWLGVHPRQERVDFLGKLLGIAAPLVPMSVVVLGWPAEALAPRTRYNVAKIIEPPAVSA
jgi:nitroreductase